MVRIATCMSCGEFFETKELRPTVIEMCPKCKEITRINCRYIPEPQIKIHAVFREDKRFAL